jgi:hypothetical protein
MGFGKGGIVLLILLSGCTSIEEEKAPCLEWTTEIIERRERLPYPMQGTIIREEPYTYCRKRAKSNDTA